MILDAIPNRELPKAISTVAFVDEELISAADWFKGKLLVEPVYYEKEIRGSVSQCFMRKGVALRLEKAMAYLPEGLTFKIYDAWRPFAVQVELFNEYVERLKNENMNLVEEEIYEKAKAFVSFPSTDLNFPPVHSTGGALDLTLVTVHDGKELTMGTRFDDFSDKAYTDYYEKDNFDIEIRDNRRILYWSMISAGFTNLPSEWWHFDYGDAFWGYYSEKPTKYRGIPR